MSVPPLVGRMQGRSVWLVSTTRSTGTMLVVDQEQMGFLQERFMALLIMTWCGDYLKSLVAGGYFSSPSADSISAELVGHHWLLPTAGQ